MTARNGTRGEVAVPKHNDDQKDQDNGNALMHAKQAEDHQDSSTEHGHTNDGEDQSLGLVSFFCFGVAVEERPYTEDDADDDADREGDGKDGRRIINLGNEAGKIPGIGFWEGADGQTVEDQKGDTAPEQHAGKRDDERGNAYVGDPESLPSTDCKACDQADENREIDVPLQIHDQGSRQSSHQGYHRSDRKIDVSSGQDAEQHA
ncbi:hypothetical protein SDC9_93417 [bioreactor metagenome]|uniref:Uncharacterized protein n=1 Tax=bioreactor metagenome TaxID=1076179 RepID=A0A645A386_9ZZZZ